jgi:CRISPR system Cascade subunit CasA
MQPAYKFRSLPLLLLAATFPGCIAYAPAPLDPASILQQQNSAALNPTALGAEIARLAPAAEWDGHRWDRLTLLATALISNSEIAHARARVSAVEAEAKAAQVAPGFNLTLTTEYAFNAPEASPWLLGIASDLPLDTGARRAARIGIAELNARIALFDYLDTVWSVRLHIRQALAKHLLASKEIALAHELRALHDRQLAAMQHRVTAGAASHTDLERIRMSAAASMQRLSDTEARAAMSALQISAALGIPSGELDTAALTWPAVEAPQALADQLPANCLDQALLARSDVARSSRQYDQAEETLKSAVASQYPMLHIGPGYTWERGLSKLPFALGLSLPALDLNHAAIAAAEARREEAGRALEATVAAARSAVAAAQSDYRAAWLQLENSRQQTDIAERLAAQAETAITAGAIDRIDWITAQTGRLTAKLDELTAVQNVRAAEAALEDALRRPLEGPELAIATDPSSSEDSICELSLPLQP